MKTPLQTIREGEREFRQWHKDNNYTANTSHIVEENTSQTLALLKALKAEVMGRKKETPVNVYSWTKNEVVGYNQALQTQADSLQKLIDELT